MRRAGLACLSLCLLLVPFLHRPDTRSRKLPLEGARNTRELGTIPVRGGQVRPGWVYRANSLEKLSDADVQILTRAGLRSVIDLRTRAVRTRHPDRAELLKTLQHVYLLPMEVHTSAGGYRRLPEDYSTEFRQLFGIFARRENYPLLYHCTAGKDRTGIVSALLLELLGAERPQIMADYLASRDNGRQFHVRREWLEGLLMAVDGAGGIDAYLERHGIAAPQREQIRRLLIVPAENR